MLGKFKDAAVNVISKNPHRSDDNKRTMSDKRPTPNRKCSKPEKYVYARPYFLGLDREEVLLSVDFGMRPILSPRKIQDMPIFAGYAECINGGKSDNNEDNSYACEMCIRSKPVESQKSKGLEIEYMSSLEETVKENPVPKSVATMEAVYFGLFDGHAGYHTSLISSRCLHTYLQNQLSLCTDLLIQKASTPEKDEFDVFSQMSQDDLIIGAIEEAFHQMDEQLRNDGLLYNVRGGCTALIVLFVNRKIYVANAGDSRAVLCHGDEIKPVSKDFTPESEKQRIYQLGSSHPELLHGEFSCIEFPSRLTANDLGTKVLCRQPGRTGWSYKTVDENDIKFPLVIGRGKNTRIMATIGVSRGLGDHDLYVYDSDVWIKPFLSSQPEVQVIDLQDSEYGEADVLIIGTDGLWDVITNNRAAEIVRRSIKSTAKDNKNRYTIAAQELVAEARGVFTGQGWRKADDRPASFDDISTFVIPLQKYLQKLNKSDPWKNTILEGSGKC